MQQSTIIMPDHAYFAKMEDELHEVKQDIRMAEADLQQAQESGDRELMWEIERRLNFLLRNKERLTTGVKNTATNSTAVGPAAISLGQLNIVSPNATGTKYLNAGLAQYCVSPLSFSPQAFVDCPLHVETEELLLYHDKLQFAEDVFYSKLAEIIPSWIEAKRVNSAAKKLYGQECSLVSPFSQLFLSSDGRPELYSYVKNDCKGFPGFNVAGKTLPDTKIEELLQYGTFTMLESYFIQKKTQDSQSDTLFFSYRLPMAFGVIASGLMGFLVSIEWCGILYYSIISKPFFLGSKEHKEAIKYLEAIVTQQSSIYSSISVNSVAIPFIKSQYRNKQGVKEVAFSVLPQQFQLFPDENSKNMPKRFVKLIARNAYDNEEKDEEESGKAASFSSPCVKVSMKRPISEYCLCVGEEDVCEQWTVSATYFRHIYRVYRRYQSIFVADCNGTRVMDVPPALVKTHLLYGMFEVAVVSSWVGARDATNSDMENTKLMDLIIDAIVWLAIHCGLLYIDIRPPNIRIDDDNIQAYLVDYDDCVVLAMEKRPSTADEVYQMLQSNTNSIKCLHLFPVVRDCFEKRCKSHSHIDDDDDDNDDSNNHMNFTAAPSSVGSNTAPTSPTSTRPTSSGEAGPAAAADDD